MMKMFLIEHGNSEDTENEETGKNLAHKYE